MRPGGVRFDLSDDIRNTLDERIKELKPQVEHVLDLLFSASTATARFEECSSVSNYDADQLGLVSPAGRASGIPYDARRCFPTGHYSQLHIP